MNLWQTTRSGRLLGVLWLAVVYSTATIALTAADSLSLFQRNLKPRRDPINIVGPKEQVDIPGPDRLDLPGASVTDSLKPMTSRNDPIAPPYTSRRTESPKEREKLIDPKDWLVGPAPGVQKNKDEELNKSFGIREYNYEQIEKTKNSSRSDWLANPNQPKPTKIKQPSDRSSDEAEQEEKRTSMAEREGDRFGAAYRSERGFTSLFDSTASANREARAATVFGNDSATLMKEFLGFSANSLKEREADARRLEYRQLLEGRSGTSPVGNTDPLATRLDAARPAPPVAAPAPILDAPGRDPRSVTFDPAELSGQGTRFRAPLFGDLNKQQFSPSERPSDTKPKTEPAMNWVRPSVLEIPRRKF